MRPVWRPDHAFLSGKQITGFLTTGDSELDIMKETREMFIIPKLVS